MEILMIESGQKETPAIRPLAGLWRKSHVLWADLHKDQPS